MSIRMPSRNKVLDRIARLVMYDPDIPWPIIYSESITTLGITREEVEEQVRRRLGGDQPPFQGAGVPKQPLPSQGSGSISLPCPENSEDEIK